MSSTEGARTFQASGAAYDSFMGRYSRRLAPLFADFAGVTQGQRVLDVGCGPGALTGELVARLAPAAVVAIDPSEPFVAACAARHPGVAVHRGTAEDTGLDDASVDAALAQLVLHFVGQPEVAARELARVVRPGGTVAACVWDFEEGMAMLRLFWDAALAVDPAAPDEARTLRFGRPGEIAELFTRSGMTGVEESTLVVVETYAGIDDLWAGFGHGIGPAGAWLVAQPDEMRRQVREGLVARLGAPEGPFSLEAVARCARATVAQPPS
ncbi:MAG: class I SAM-dependent methyltransferase [Acidimicrobiia bacterium]|nr:class I SAM-dependent methyltransferase [Acidimicrobiia bacterium]MDH5288673.1 class I SAM-dependent methyltransferase [Acidimicrobiia bacterium]